MKKGMRKRTKVILTILIVLLLLIGGGLLIANHYLNKINRENLDDVVAPTEETFETDGDDAGSDPNKITWPGIEPFDDDKLLNILLVGQDRLPGQGRQRSDTMILCSVNTETGEIAMISFLRDLYVHFPGDYSDNRLNAAYAFAGFPLLKETLMLNFGVSIDGCFEVDFDGFSAIIDMLGGVDIEVTQAEADYVSAYGFTAGMNHMNGEQALGYARIRGIDSDFNRTARQRYVLTQVFNKVRGCGVSELMSLVNNMLPYVTTDLSNAQIMSMAMQGAKILNGATLNTYHVPEDDCYYNDMIRGMAVLVPDLTLIHERLGTYLPLD